MNATKWTQVRIRNELYTQIEKAVGSIKKRGLEEYDSVPKFVQKACMDLLEKHMEVCKH